MLPAALARLQPEPAALLSRAQEAADVAAYPHCRAVVEAALAHDVAEHGRRLTPLEEAQCALAEQMAFSVADVTDAQVAALREHLDEAEVWAFVVAVHEIDMDVRLGLLAGAVL